VTQTSKHIEGQIYVENMPRRVQVFLLKIKNWNLQKKNSETKIPETERSKGPSVATRS